MISCDITGGFEVKSLRGRKSTTWTLVEHEAIIVEEATSSGVQTYRVRGIAGFLDMPASTMNKIIRKIFHYYHYKFTHVAELLPADLPRRQMSAPEFLIRMELDSEWIWNIFRTDKALSISKEL